MQKQTIVILMEMVWGSAVTIVLQSPILDRRIVMEMVLGMFVITVLRPITPSSEMLMGMVLGISVMTAPEIRGLRSAMVLTTTAMG